MTELEHLSRAGWLISIQHHADHSQGAPEPGAPVFTIHAWRVAGDTIASQRIDTHKATRPTLTEAAAALHEAIR